MSDSDQLTGSAELHELRGSLSGVAVPEPPPLNAIMARGRARRRHRRYSAAGLFAVGAGTAAALVVGLTGAPAPGPTLGTIRTAAYTIVGNPDGTATLTIDPNEVFDPARLQSDLAQYGIPAMVAVGSFCSSDPAPAGLSQVVSYHPAGEDTSTPQPSEQATVTIDPTAMPAGTELSFGEFELSTGGELASFALIDKGAYTCSSTAPTSSPTLGGLLIGGSQAS
jgi:hypothetical protein